MHQLVPRCARILQATLIGLLLAISAPATLRADAAQRGYGFGRGNQPGSATPVEQVYEMSAPSASHAPAIAHAPESAPPLRIANTFDVTTAADTGIGCLRSAITLANLSPGLDLITFHIGSGFQSLAPTSQLPDITDPVTIDGTTQPGFGGAPIIELSGASAGSNAIGLVVKGGGSTIRGLIINRFATTGSGGFGIVLDAGTGNVVAGNYIGTDPTGTLARPNAVNGIAIFGTSTGNVIGGTTPADRNVLSGNTSSGIQIGTGNGGFNFIFGNYIGVKADGAAPLPNGGNGVFVNASDNTIGGRVPGAGNVISGNAFPGIFIGLNAQRIIVQGNYIGTDATGLLDVGNSQNGVYVDRSPNNVIGDSTGVARNIIAGNEFPGVYLFGATAATNRVQGNFICVDKTGAGALGDGNGIVIDAAPDNLIGGSTVIARNVIAGTPLNVAMSVINGSTRNRILGNYIGTDSSGTSPVPNLKGILLNNSPGNFVGGTSAGQGNVISGNVSFGVELRNAGATANRLYRNFIGTDFTGTTAVGNGSHGVCIISSVDTVANGNTIAFNAGAGVYDSSGTGNVIRGNHIFRNAGLGIDLFPRGLSPNDSLDVDAGVNDLQNYPMLDSASVSGGLTHLHGRMSAKPNRTYLLDFFRSDSADASHFGEGQTYISSQTIATDATGVDTFLVELPAVPLTQFLSATATDVLSGTTSEFSQAMGLNDADGDGLWDYWETPGWGIDINSDGVPDLDLAARGARPNHKDLFVEVDAMNDQKPTPATLPMVIDAFANVSNTYLANPDGQPGIALHMALDDSALSQTAMTPMWSSFAALKQTTFGTATEKASANRFYILQAKRLAYRYALFGRTFCSGRDTLHGGIAEMANGMGGDDLLITLGSTGGCGWKPVAETRIYAGTFMHELGHTLGLWHGGADNLFFKTNYYSVMNYMWQTPQKWHAPKAWRLDYSRAALPRLIEDHLNENAGLGAPANVWPIVTIPYLDNGLQIRQARLEPGAKVDWSGDGTLQADVQGDINILNFGQTDCLGNQDWSSSPSDTMNGYVDWPNLQYNFRNSPAFRTTFNRCGGTEPLLAADGEDTSPFEMTVLDHRQLDQLPPPAPQGQFVMDGVLDPTAGPVASNAGVSLYAAYRAGQLYLATQSAPSQNADMVVLVSDSRGNLRSAPLGKAGQAGAWSAYLSNRVPGNTTSWSDQAEAPLTSVTTDTSSVLAEGVVDVGLLYGEHPPHLYLAVGKYGTTAGGTLLAQVPAGNGDGNIDGSEYFDFLVPATVSVSPADPVTGLRLSPIRPNPVLGTARMLLTLGQAANVDVVIQDVSGRRIATLVHGPMAAGEHELSWNPVADSGRRHPPGVYFLVVRALGGTRTERIVLIR